MNQEMNSTHPAQRDDAALAAWLHDCWEAERVAPTATAPDLRAAAFALTCLRLDLLGKPLAECTQIGHQVAAFPLAAIRLGEFWGYQRGRAKEYAEKDDLLERCATLTRRLEAESFRADDEQHRADDLDAQVEALTADLLAANQRAEALARAFVAGSGQRRRLGLSLTQLWAALWLASGSALAWLTGQQHKEGGWTL